jgi:hypothetical protein
MRYVLPKHHFRNKLSGRDSRIWATLLGPQSFLLFAAIGESRESTDFHFQKIAALEAAEDNL